MKICSTCKIEKELSEFGYDKRTKDNKRYQCKKCTRDYNNNWINNNKEKYKKTYYKNYSIHKDKARNDKDYSIKAWAMKWRSTRRKIKFMASRKNVSLDYLIELANKALLIFPYLQFAFGNKNKAYTASVDRIDSKKPYSNDNIKIIPFWLNSAKLDLNEEEFKELIRKLPTNLEW